MHVNAGAGLTMAATDPANGRGTGRTKRAMQSAPPDAVYVLPHQGMEPYARALARHLGVKLQFRSMQWLLQGHYRGLDANKIVLDHACVDSVDKRDWDHFKAFLVWHAVRTHAR